MWHPIDPDEPTSEPYRLMSPRKRSELREALDAATGSGYRADRSGRDEVGEVTLSGPTGGKLRWHARPWVRWAGGIAAALLVAIAAQVIATQLSGWLATSPSSRVEPTPATQTEHGATAAAPSWQGRP